MDRIDIYLKTKEIYIDGFAYAIPRIALERYCEINGLDQREFMKTYWETKPPKTQTEADTKRRLAKKKKQQKQLRKL